MITDGSVARQRIVEAASARFRRFGFRHASVASIAEAAGTAKGSMYLHYPSKEELYLDVVRIAVAEFVEAADAAMAAEASAPARLRALVVAAVAHYEREELLSAPLLDDRELLGARAASLARQLQRDRITGLIGTTLARGQAEGSIRAELDSETAAIVLFEIGWGIVRSHLSGELGLPLSDALSTLNEILGHGTAAAPDTP